MGSPARRPALHCPLAPARADVQSESLQERESQATRPASAQEDTDASTNRRRSQTDTRGRAGRRPPTMKTRMCCGRAVAARLPPGPQSTLNSLSRRAATPPILMAVRRYLCANSSPNVLCTPDGGRRHSASACTGRGVKQTEARVSGVPVRLRGFMTWACNACKGEPDLTGVTQEAARIA